MACVGTVVMVLAMTVTHGDLIVSDEQHAAMAHFFDAYMNTGCDEDEAAEMTISTFIACDAFPERVYSEALRYEDM